MTDPNKLSRVALERELPKIRVLFHWITDAGGDIAMDPADNLLLIQLPPIDIERFAPWLVRDDDSVNEDQAYYYARECQDRGATLVRFRLRDAGYVDGRNRITIKSAKARPTIRWRGAPLARAS